VACEAGARDVVLTVVFFAGADVPDSFANLRSFSFVESSCADAIGAHIALPIAVRNAANIAIAIPRRDMLHCFMVPLLFPV
jgi:hypothetical protein